MDKKCLTRRTVLGALAGTAAVSLAAPRIALAADEIVAGATLPLTGSLASAGQQQQFAMQLAQDEINKAGGIDGRPLSIVYEDAQSSNSAAVNAFLSVTRRVNPVFVFLSSYTTQNLAVEPSIARAGLPCVYGGGGVSVADRENPWMFRIRPEDSIQANAMVEFASENLNSKVPGILNVQNDFGQGIVSAAGGLFKEKGISLAGTESFAVGDSDFSAQILGLVDKGVDTLILVAYPREGALILKQCYQLGFKGSVLTSSGVMLPSAIDLMEPDELANVYGIVDVLLSADRGPRVKAYVDEFDKRYGVRADAFGVCYYNAAHLLRQAIEAAGTEPEKLRDYFAGVSGFQGIGETFSTDQRGNMIHSLDIVKFKPGTIVQEYVRTVSV